MDDTPGLPNPAEIGRRRVLLGAGVTALAAAGSLGAQPAAAKPSAEPSSESSTEPSSAPQPSAADETRDAKIASTLASAPVSGYVYRHLDFFDFTPEHPDSQRTWSPAGVFVNGPTSPLWGSLEIPPGARVAEIEWYYYNPSAVALFGRARLWGAGLSGLANTVLDLQLPTNSALGARRAFVQLVNSGPFGPGVKLALGFDSGGKAYLNGVRVGFSGGGGMTGLLRDPIRVYDSRTVAAGKLTANEIRPLTLPTSVMQPGMTGVVINLTAVGATNGGNLKVYPANAILPPAVSSINFSGSGAAIANGLLVGVSAAGQVKVQASQAVHVIVDLAGTIG